MCAARARESRGNSDATPNNIAALRIFNTDASVVPEPIAIGASRLTDGNFMCTWSGGNPPFTVQRRAALTGIWTEAAANLESRTYSTPAGVGESYFRVIGGR